METPAEGQKKHVGRPSHGDIWVAVEECTKVVSGGADSKICIYNAETGEVVYDFYHGGIIQCVEFNQNPAYNDRIVTCANKFKDTPNCIQVHRFGFDENMEGWNEKNISFASLISSNVHELLSHRNDV